MVMNDIGAFLMLDSVTLARMQQQNYRIQAMACVQLASSAEKPSSRNRFAPGFVTWRISVSIVIF
jgi:hypothetical protein